MGCARRICLYSRVSKIKYSTNKIPLIFSMQMYSWAIPPHLSLSIYIYFNFCFVILFSNLFIIGSFFILWVLLLLQGISSYTAANRNSIKGRIKTTGSNMRSFYLAVEQTKTINGHLWFTQPKRISFLYCVLCNTLSLSLSVYIMIIKFIAIKKSKKKETRKKEKEKWCKSEQRDPRFLEIKFA